MALTTTTTAGAMTLGANVVTLTAFTNPSSGGVGARTVARVDGEEMLITDATLSPTVQVVRGWNGTTATAHNSLAPVVYGIATDWTQQNLGTAASAPQYSYSANSTIINPTVDSVIYITKGSLCALTLTDPPADSQVTVRILSLSAFAHTVTYATGFNDNTTSSDIATYAATPGNSMTIKAQSGKWRLIALAGVTVA